MAKSAIKKMPPKAIVKGKSAPVAKVKIDNKAHRIIGHRTLSGVRK